MMNGEKITPLIVNARVAHEHNQATNNTITYKVYDSNSEHSLQHAVEVRSAHCSYTVPEHSFVTLLILVLLLVLLVLVLLLVVLLVVVRLRVLVVVVVVVVVVVIVVLVLLLVVQVLVVVLLVLVLILLYYC
jgi:hypothetical protein